MLLIHQMKNRYVSYILSLSVAMMCPVPAFASVIPNGAYAEETQGNRYLNSSYDQTLLEKKESQMKQHIEEIPGRYKT